MILKSLTLRQFRSHTLLETSVHPGVNLFLGLNGAGKTNLIEAISVLATGMSPRGAEIGDMVQWGTNGFAIKATFFKSEDFTLEMKYKVGSQRTVQQNGETTVRLRDLLGKIPLVSFVPEDLTMVKGEPDLRRQAINMILCQVDGLYAESLRRYNDVVKSRNAALKQVADGKMGTDALVPWDLALIEAGLIVCQKRQVFLFEFSELAADVHHRLSGGKETLQLSYEPSFPGPWDATAGDRWRRSLESSRSQELAMGVTVMGPHRDNMIFMVNGRPAKAFASEGQKRTCAVSFKLAEIPYIQKKLNQKPLCLLDDVLSELDVERAQHLLDELSKTGQCFVTLTGLESWPQDRALPATIFRVDASGVKLDEALSTPAIHEELAITH